MNSQRETLQNSEKMAQQAIAKDPTFVDAYAFLSHAYALEATNFQENGAHDLALAEQTARKAIALNPNLFEANLALGAVYTEQGKDEDAIRLLRLAVSLAPNSPVAWKYLGYAYHYAGLTDLAEAAFRRGRDLDPTPAQAYWMHGRMLLYQGKAPRGGGGSAPRPGALSGAVQAAHDAFRTQTLLYLSFHKLCCGRCL